MVWSYVPETHLPKTIRMFSTVFEPPKKIQQTFYMCDKHFHLDPILEMYKEEETIGIIFVTGKMYAIYRVIKTGNHFEHKKIMSANVLPLKKHNKGGSSSARFGRIHDEKEDAYIKKLGELVVKSFMGDNNTTHLVKKLVIAGPGEKKGMLANDDLVRQYFKDKLVIMNTSDVNDQTILETIGRTREIFERDSGDYEDRILDDIGERMMTADDKLVYGLMEVNQSLNRRELKMIVTNESVSKQINKNDLGKCELVVVSDGKLKRLGIPVFGIKYY